MKECCSMENIDVEIPDVIKEELQEKGGFEHICSSIPSDDIEKLNEIIKSLADVKRLMILYALAHQRMCVCMLVELTKCPYSKCSYHITKLREMGLIQAENLGNYLIYSLTRYGVQILKYLEKINEVKK